MSIFLSQMLHHLKVFLRRPIAAFFVVALPLILMVVFSAIFAEQKMKPGQPTASQFYAPALAVFGAVSATFTYLAVSTAFAREAGILKRIQGTPMRPGLYIASRIVAAALIGLVAIFVMMATGVLAYDVTLFPDRLPGAIAVLMSGTLAFSALGMLVAGLARNGETAQAVTNATLLPLAFLSNIFVQPEFGIPPWLLAVGDVFPLKHFADGFGAAFRPGLSGSGLVWEGDDKTYAALKHIAVLCAWGVGAGLVAVRFFGWSPSRTAS